MSCIQHICCNKKNQTSCKSIEDIIRERTECRISIWRKNLQFNLFLGKGINVVSLIEKWLNVVSIWRKNSMLYLRFSLYLGEGLNVVSLLEKGHNVVSLFEERTQCRIFIWLNVITVGERTQCCISAVGRWPIKSTFCLGKNSMLYPIRERTNCRISIWIKESSICIGERSQCRISTFYNTVV